MGIDEQTLSEIVRRVLTVAKPDKIILFGSAATDRMSRDSDIDLLIVEPDISNQRSQYARVRRALWGIDHPFDIVFISSQWFEESKNAVGGIAHPANKYGRVIYEAA
ncbi:MAG: nucleotidyltransferase domain-containing protein [Phycisphaerae bacterium]